MILVYLAPKLWNTMKLKILYHFNILKIDSRHVMDHVIALNVINM